MIELRLQMFGGRGGSSGNAGNKTGETNNSYLNRLNNDTVHIWKIQINENGKIRTEEFVGTEWEMKRNEQQFAAQKGFTYSEYLRQSRYSYNSWIDSPNDAPISRQDLIRKVSGSDKETTKRAISYYEKEKKEFIKRYKAWLKTK